MRFVNLTPHSLTFRTPDGDQVVEASGLVARVSTTAVPLRTLNGMSLRTKSFGQVQNLPDPHVDDVHGETVFVVSGMVLDALRNSGCTRTDVVAPATGPNDGAVRNEAGHVVAVTQLDVLA